MVESYWCLHRNCLCSWLGMEGGSIERIGHPQVNRILNWKRKIRDNFCILNVVSASLNLDESLSFPNR